VEKFFHGPVNYRKTRPEPVHISAAHPITQLYSATTYSGNRSTTSSDDDIQFIASVPHSTQTFEPIDHDGMMFVTGMIKAMAESEDFLRPEERKKNLPLLKALAVCKTPGYIARGQPLFAPTKLHRVQADGHCYYRAISVALTGFQKFHTLLRTYICHKMQTTYSEAMARRSGEENYWGIVDGMRNSDKWATDNEIQATAWMFEVDIVIWARKDVDDCGCERAWNWFRATTDNTSAHTIFLTNDTGDHFDLVLGC
jgi:hypothetical protein